MVKGKTCHHLGLQWLGHLSKINISFLDLPFSETMMKTATLSDDELDNQSAYSRPWKTIQSVASFPFM